MPKNIFFTVLSILFSLSCGKKQNSIADETNVSTNVESVSLLETPSSEDLDEGMQYEDALDIIIRRKNETYRSQINSSPFRAEIMKIDSTTVEKNFSELLNKFDFSDYETKGKPSSTKEKELEKAFEKEFKSFIEEIRKEIDQDVNGDFSYSLHTVVDINGDNINDGYVRFIYGFGLLANTNVGYAFFIYKDGKFEFVQSFDARGFGWSEESPDLIIGVVNNLIYATSSEYIESDARCCPSIDIKKVYKLIDGKIVEIYRTYSKTIYSDD